MTRSGLTRRRALALGVTAGAGTLLARTPTPSFASTSLFSMPVRTGRTLKAPRRFDLVGIRGGGVEAAQLELRTRREGAAWTKWMHVHAGADHRPDGGTGAHASDPIWVDGAHELQLRAAGPVARGMRLQFVAVSAVARVASARVAERLRTTARLRQTGAPAIMPRAAWGARAAHGNPGFGEVQMAFVHHTVTANTYAAADVPAILKSIQAYHMDSNGWNDIGYNFLVDRFGTIWEGRAGGIDQPVIGAQAQGWNSDSTGVSNIGTFSDVAQTPAAIEANAQLIAWKLAVHAAPVAGTVALVSGGGSSNRFPSGRVVTFPRIAGHRDANSTSCPGTALYGQLAAIRSRAAQLAPQFAAAAGRVTLAGSSVAVAYGEQLQLTGTVSRTDATPAAIVPILIQKRGTKDWVSIAKTQTDQNGAYAWPIVWRSTGRLRVRADFDGGIAVSPATTFQCLPRLSSITRRVRASSQANVRGKVRPASTFDVLVERKAGSSFRRVGTYSVKAKRSVFKARLPLRRAGRYRVTPVVTSGPQTFKGQSLLLRVLH